MKTPLRQIDNCDNCGACCTGQEALPVGYWLGVMVSDRMRRKLPPELLTELQTLRDQFDRDGWPANGEACVWYDAARKRCRHYEWRPDVCRDAIKPGDVACRRWRADTGVDPQRRFKLINGKLTEVFA